MKSIRRYIICGLLAALGAGPVHGARGLDARDVRFRCEAADTAQITQLLAAEAAHRDAPRLSRIGLQLLDTPYASGTLESGLTTPEGQPLEVLTVGLDSLDCTTFVETVLALAYTVDERRLGWQDFVYNLRRFRYRDALTDGYASRLHYPSAWILDCAARGLLREATGDIPAARYQIKSLDFMTAHRGSYPALADSATYAQMKNVEAGLRSYRYPLLKGSALSEKALRQVLRDGDIVCLTTAQPGLDVFHMGIVVIDPDDPSPRLLHASSKHGRVVVDPLPLADYLRRNRVEGIRIVRMVRE